MPELRPRDRLVVMLAFEGGNLVDVAGPLQAFDSANHLRPPGAPGYRLLTVSEHGGAVTTSPGLPLLTEPLSILAGRSIDTLIVPGGLPPEGPTHLGGLIAAGPRLAQNALRGGTARLAAVPAGRVVEIADNSADAIESGTWLSAAALTERFLAQTGRRLGSAPQLILTGGGAAQLSALLGATHRIDAQLVLRGLAMLADARD